jgi:hypothetical protein
MIIKFLQFCETNKLDEKNFIAHLNEHKLLDVLIIQTLKSKVQFLFNEQIEFGTN